MTLFGWSWGGVRYTDGLRRTEAPFAVVESRWIDPVDAEPLSHMVEDVATRLDCAPARVHIRIVPPSEIAKLADTVTVPGGAHAESLCFRGAKLVVVPSPTRRDLLAHEIAHALGADEPTAAKIERSFR